MRPNPLLALIRTGRFADAKALLQHLVERSRFEPTRFVAGRAVRAYRGALEVKCGADGVWRPKSDDGPDALLPRVKAGKLPEVEPVNPWDV